LRTAGRVGQHDDGAHECPGERADDDAREQEYPGVEAAARHQGQPVHQSDGGQRRREMPRPGTDQAPPEPLASARTAPSPAPPDSPSRYGSARRIPNHGLERGAADGEAPADQEGEQHARRPQLADDGGGSRIGAEEPAPDVAESERHRAGGEAQREGNRDDGGERD
jgi:hypothetical protein